LRIFDGGRNTDEADVPSVVEIASACVAWSFEVIRSRCSTLIGHLLSWKRHDLASDDSCKDPQRLLSPFGR
jgi:hypothetical protein